VGAGDSGFTGLLNNHMAAMRNASTRPAFVDITASQVTHIAHT